MPTYIDGYEIDAVISEDHQLNMDITDHPVEKGVDVTDHARLRPRVVTMDCVVTDTPVGGLAQRRGLDPSAGLTLEYIPSNVARVFMEGLQVNRAIVLLSKEWTRTDGSRGYKAYDNMMVQSIGETITADTGDSFQFKVTFKQINFVTNNRTTVKVAVPRAKKKIDKGNKPNQEKEEPRKTAVTAAQMVFHTFAGDSGNMRIGTGAIGGLLGGH